jgi:hypothetical protein
MAAYAVEVKIINGQPETAAAEAETYIETLDSTNDAIISVDVVGGNDFVTFIIVHNVGA